MPLEVFPGSPLAPPNAKLAISTVVETGLQRLRKVLYFRASDAVSSASPDIHRWLWELEKHSD